MGHAPSGILLALTAICDKSELRVLCAIFVFDFDFVTYYIHFTTLCLLNITDICICDSLRRNGANVYSKGAAREN